MDDRTDRIGIFPSWNSLYALVIIYTVLLILLLYALTRSLDYGVL